MTWHIAAVTTLTLHLAFIAFVVSGGLLAWRRRWIAWLHLPAAIWGTWIEFSGAVCPLTVIENTFRERAGLAGYGDGFIAHYLLATIYPAGLTRQMQFALAALVVAVNLIVYARLLRSAQPRVARGRRSGGRDGFRR